MRGMWVAAALVAIGCGPSRPAWQPSEAMQTSARMLRQLDKLEADLNAGNAETGTYAELVRRHGHAQEIACKVTDEHVAEIHRLFAAQQEKLRERRMARKKALAQLTTRRRASAIQ